MMITPGGHKVAPVEVEQALSAHAAVEEVAVTAAPDAERGQTVLAWVVLSGGVEPDDALRSELQLFVKERRRGTSTRGGSFSWTRRPATRWGRS